MLIFRFLETVNGSEISTTKMECLITQEKSLAVRMSKTIAQKLTR